MRNNQRLQTTDNFIAELKAYALFADTLATCLRQMGVRQVHLARRMYVEAATVHNWRTNKRLPDRVMVYKIGQSLGLTSEHRTVLSEAWRVTRLARELIPCVEEATRTGDTLAVIALRNNFAAEQRAVELLVRQHINDASRDRVVHETALPRFDPEIWVYATY